MRKGRIVRTASGLQRRLRVHLSIWFNLSFYLFISRLFCHVSVLKFCLVKWHNGISQRLAIILFCCKCVCLYSFFFFIIFTSFFFFFLASLIEDKIIFSLQQLRNKRKFRNEDARDGKQAIWKKAASMQKLWIKLRKLNRKLKN